MIDCLDNIFLLVLNKFLIVFFKFSYQNGFLLIFGFSLFLSLFQLILAFQHEMAE